MNNNKESKRLYLLQYDGVNLFYKSKWTHIEFKSLEIGRKWLKFLITLPDEQVEHWIKIYKESK